MGVLLHLATTPSQHYFPQTRVFDTENGPH